ncbi:AbrB/MazE/SpoVT family DNA-binding domain-containing protein [Candidatus Woesearchaeota archaeon]|nr:AbrB/MazE/SpoVT family DNA-binding domain-containing protein [Candidatus Woesearchaeota archaeon]
MITAISKGLQITIPADIREELGLGIGSKVDIECENGKIIIKPVGEELEEIFKKTTYLKPKFKLTAKQMDEHNEKMFR